MGGRPVSVCRLILAYDGLDFHGWQVQPGKRTVQGELARSLAVVLRRETKVVGAGRTDAGVHALGQCASFELRRGDPDPRRLFASLRGLLPADITVLELSEVHPDFHARFSATGRHYLYRVGLRRMAPLRRRRWETRYRLDEDRMRAALQALPGRHDFRGFCRAQAAEKGSICDLRQATLDREGDELHLRLGADRFLHNMVRIIAGTLVDVGRGRFGPERIAEMLESGDRSMGGNTAPPRGLYLVRADYPPELLKP